MAAAHYRGNKNGSHMGKYTRSTEEDEAQLWCIRNNIRITPRQAKWGEPIWYIDIAKGVWPNLKHLGTSPDFYGPTRIWQKISEYQLYYSTLSGNVLGEGFESRRTESSAVNIPRRRIRGYIY